MPPTASVAPWTALLRPATYSVTGGPFFLTLEVPGTLRGFILEGPGDEATLLVALGHVDRAHVERLRVGERTVYLIEMFAPRDQRGEPEHRARVTRAFGDHRADETFLTTLAPQFTTLATEVEVSGSRRRLLVQVACLADVACSGFAGGGVERRVAHAHVKAIFGTQ